MCLQDLRIQAGLRLRELSTVIPASGELKMPSFRTATLIHGLATGGLFKMVFKDESGSNNFAPTDTRFAVFNTAQGVYSRESLGPLLFGPLFVTGAAGDSVKVWWYEYDAAVDHAVSQSLSGGVV